MNETLNSVLDLRYGRELFLAGESSCAKTHEKSRESEKMGESDVVCGKSEDFALQQRVTDDDDCRNGPM